MILKTLGSWVFVIGGCAVSSYYLNWIAYGPAASQDGSLRGVLQLGMKWYGIPLVIVVQLLVWLVMPRLFKITPSPWIAALVWPLISAISKTVIVWQIKRPDTSDWVTIIGMFIVVAVAWVMKKG